MLSKKRNRYEDKHLKNPAFLEKYFQRKPVWVVTVILLTALMIWGLSIAVPDILRIKDDADFDFTFDLIVIFGSLFMIYFGTGEYRFYQREIWNKKKRK